MSCGGFFNWKNVFLWHFYNIGMLCINEEMYRYVTSGSEGLSTQAVHYGRTEHRPRLSELWRCAQAAGAECPDPPNNTTAAWASPAPTTSSVSLCCVSEPATAAAEYVTWWNVAKKISSDYHYIEKWDRVAKLEFLKCHEIWKYGNVYLIYHSINF